VLQLRPGLLVGVRAVAQALVRHGWAEASAGNLSIRCGGTLVVKRAGARMRDLAANPSAGLCLVSARPPHRVTPASARPTSELPTHLACHALLPARRPTHRAVLHTHPTHLCALSLVVRPPRSLLARLDAGHAELAQVRGRVTVIATLPPGSAALARATARAVRDHEAVVWPRHGVVATGRDLGACLDLIEVLDKLAELQLLSRR